MRKFFFYLMSILYIAAGINHFVNPNFYMKIMPSYLPFHKELILLSGIFEILAGVLLLIPKTKRIGAWAVVVLLIAVFPANIQMALDYYNQQNPFLWVAFLRLPLQFFLIWWAYLYTKKDRV